MDFLFFHFIHFFAFLVNFIGLIDGAHCAPYCFALGIVFAPFKK
jgi:hypothetical protein